MLLKYSAKNNSTRFDLYCYLTCFGDLRPILNLLMMLNGELFTCELFTHNWFLYQSKWSFNMYSLLLVLFLHPPFSNTHRHTPHTHPPSVGWLFWIHELISRMCQGWHREGKPGSCYKVRPPTDLFTVCENLVSVSHQDPLLYTYIPTNTRCINLLLIIVVRWDKYLKYLFLSLSFSFSHLSKMKLHWVVDSFRVVDF